MKRILSLTLALVMVLGTFTGVFAAETTVEAEAGAFLESVGVLLGDTEGNLNLNGNLERRDAVILLSRLLGVEEEAAEFETSEETPSWEDARTDAYYVPFFAWAETNEYFEGDDEGNFNPRNAITAQEYALVLLRALGYEASGHEAWKAALETAEELGLLVDVEVENADEVVRGQMAVMTLNALKAEMKDSDKTLAEELNINLPTPPEATEVEEVYAENLKEVVVVFDGEVDAVTAEDEDNYELNKSITVEDAVLNEELNTVVLTVSEMNNQVEYELTVSNVKAGDTTLATEKVKFTTLDNALPEVEEVRSLGTKALKVIVSEPVKEAKTSNFKIDGKNYFGSIDVNGREITLKPYNASTVLAPGEHTLEVSGLLDYMDFKSLKDEIEFIVVEDNDAPEVVEINATLEKATIVFNEDIDPDTVKRTNFYWKSGNSKMTPDTVEVKGNKVVLEFSGSKKLPAYETTLYIIDVADYSGNKMDETEILVRATVDQTRPEVVKVEVVEDNENQIIIKFNKSLDKDSAEKRDNYKIEDVDGDKVSIRKVTLESSKEVKVELYDNLPEGVNTLSISGVADNTTLKNVMLPVSFELEVGDTDAPTVKSISVSNGKITIIFSEEMDLASIADTNNYLIKAGTWRVMPSSANIDVFNNGEVVIIELPEKIDSKKVIFEGTADSDEIKVTHIQVVGAEDLAGNSVAIEEIGLVLGSAKIAVKDDVYQVKLVDQKTLEIEFDQVIVSAKKAGITVVDVYDNDLSDYTVEADGTNTVKVVFDEKIGTDSNVVSIKIVPGEDNFETLTGANAEASELVSVIDKVAPEVDKVEKVDYRTIKVTFTENIETTSKELAARDFNIYRVSDNETLTAGTDYTVKVNADKTVTITLTEDGLVDDGSYYEVKVLDAEYITDAAGNEVADSDAEDINLTR